MAVAIVPSLALLGVFIWNRKKQKSGPAHSTHDTLQAEIDASKWNEDDIEDMEINMGSKMHATSGEPFEIILMMDRLRPLRITLFDSKTLLRTTFYPGREPVKKTIKFVSRETGNTTIVPATISWGDCKEFQPAMQTHPRISFP